MEKDIGSAFNEMTTRVEVVETRLDSFTSADDSFVHSTDAASSPIVKAMESHSHAIFSSADGNAKTFGNKASPVAQRKGSMLGAAAQRFESNQTLNYFFADDSNQDDAGYGDDIFDDNFGSGIPADTRKYNRRRESLLPPTTPAATSGGKSVPPTANISYIKPSALESDLRLTKISVDGILYFMELFSEMCSRTTEDLHLSTFIAVPIRERMKSAAREFNLPGQRGILDRGVQIISNEEVYHILTAMATPKSREEMHEQLLKSCFPAIDKFTEKFGSTIKMENFEMFYDSMQVYRDRWFKKMKFFSYVGSEIMPKRLFGRHKELGLTDYFTKGIPFEKFGDNLWRGVSSEERDRVKTLNQYLDLFYESLQEIRDNFRASRINARTVGNKKSDEKPIRESSSSDRDQSKFVRHHALTNAEPTKQTDHQETQQDADDAALDDASENGSVDDQLDLAEIVEGEFDQLETLGEKRTLTKEEQAQKPCYTALKHGKCDKSGCLYNHTPAFLRAAAEKEILEINDGPWGNNHATGGFNKRVEILKNPNAAGRDNKRNAT